MIIKKIKLASLFFYLSLIIFTASFLISNSAFASAGKAHIPNKKIPVIIDTDMGVDDWFALLYLLNRPDVEVLAVTMPITGESSCRAGLQNINKLIDLSGKMANKTIPVACGKPYTQKFIAPFPKQWRNEADVLAGIALPPSSRIPLTMPAEQLIQEVVAKQASLGVKPIVITLGPLTTLANILEQNPDFKNQVAHVMSMGGAVSVKGNVHYLHPTVTKNRVSEWNFYADPLAAKKVIESGIAFKLVPLDATDTVPLNQAFMKKFKQSRKTKIAQFIYMAINQRIKIQNHSSYCFWDCLTVAMVFDSNMGSFKSLPIRVRYGDPLISGQTVVDHQHGHHIQVALSANPQRFHQDFLEVINRQ